MPIMAHNLWLIWRFYLNWCRIYWKQKNPEFGIFQLRNVEHLLRNSFYATYNESKSGNFWSSWPSFWNGFRWMWQWQNEHLWQLQRLIPSRAIFLISSSIPSRCLKWSWDSYDMSHTQILSGYTPDSVRPKTYLKGIWK